MVCWDISDYTSTCPITSSTTTTTTATAGAAATAGGAAAAAAMRKIHTITSFREIVLCIQV